MSETVINQPTQEQTEALCAIFEKQEDKYTDAAHRYLGKTAMCPDGDGISRQSTHESLLYFLEDLQKVIDSGEYIRDGQGNIVHKSINDELGENVTNSIIGPETVTAADPHSTIPEGAGIINQSWVNDSTILSLAQVEPGSYVDGSVVLDSRISKSWVYDSEVGESRLTQSTIECCDIIGETIIKRIITIDESGVKITNPIM